MTTLSSKPEVNLLLIGCGTPTPTPERFGSSMVLDMGNERLMFDCGPASTYKLRRTGLMPTDISHLFFTHHHYDHNADYPCFLLCRWDHEREGIPRLKVYGAPPTAKITERLIGDQGAFVDDWQVRVDLPASQQVYAARGGKVPRPKPKFDICEIKAGDCVETNFASVTAGTAIHLQPMMDCLCYRVDWDGGAMVVTGDAGRSDEIETLAKGANTLVVNIWDFQEKMTPAMTSGFCGTLDAAHMAAASGVSRLVATHQGPNLCRPGSMDKAISDMAAVFTGEIVFAQEFMTIDLTGTKND
jgi:ribonuclease BN (tRNA processing enzyme)